MKFRKKPVVIEAIQYDETKSSFDEMVSTWGANFLVSIMPLPEIVRKQIGPSLMLEIQTLEGRMRVNKGDWIIRGVAGEFYPCRNDIFKKTYEAVC